jgi:plasmid maintenance system antidote protein VapI
VKLRPAIRLRQAATPPIKGLHVANRLPPIHPGEILWEEFLVPLKLTPDAVATALHVPRIANISLEIENKIA